MSERPTLPPDPPVPPPPVCFPLDPGLYVIRNVATGTVMHQEHTAAGAGEMNNICGFKFQHDPNQYWDVQPSDNDVNMTIRNTKTNSYAAYQKFKQEEHLQSSTRPHEYIITQADNGFYIAPKELPTHVFDLTRGLTADGTKICLWVKHMGDHQKWKFEAKNTERT